MYNVTQAFKDAIKGNGREFKATIAIRDNNVFDDNNIIDVELSEDVNPSDSFMIGSVASNKIEATLINLPNNLILDGAKIAPKIGLNTGTAYEDVPLGIFWIDEIQKVNNAVKITAFDSMIKLEKAYFSDLNYPASINAVAQEICNNAGVELATVLPNTQINKIEGYTYREAISFIASFLGGFARFSRDGKLEITSYVDTDTTITADYYVKNPINGEQAFSIGKLSCKVGDSILSSGSSGNEVQFENPIMTQSQLDSIYSTLKNISYMPFDMEWKGNHALQAGDKINIVDPNGNTYNTLLMQNQLSYKGSIAGKASAKANTGQKQEFNSNGSIKNTVDRMVVEQANIKLLLADTATIESLNATNAKIDNLTANVATISQLNATNARIVTLEANSATIAQLNAVKANINDLTADKANITDLTASNGRITTLESKAASIDTLLAGNISVSNLQAGLITADSGLIANGAIKDAMIADLSASKITAGTINGANINVINLNADNITVGRLNGQLLKDGSVSGLAVSSGAIDNSKVASNAAIEGSKLNISSVVTAINSGSTLLTSNKINIDADNGTLDVAFKNLKSTVTSTTNAVSSQGTVISAIQGQISSKVWQQDITTAVTGIQVGGRNLLLNSSFSKDLTSWTGVGSIVNNTLEITATGSYARQQQTVKVKPSTQYTFSIDVVDMSDINSFVVFLWEHKSDGNTTSVYKDNGITFQQLGRIYYTITTQPDCSTLYVLLQANNSKTVHLKNVKLEEGNKATSWTSAPEDTDSQITTINTNYSTLNQTVNGINLNVSSLQTTTSNLGTRMSTAESSISTLSNSIVLKVNTTDFNTYKTSNDSVVSSKASQGDLNTTNTNLGTLTTRVSTAESSISVLQGQIVSKVSQTDIDNSINNINIGGRNLYFNSDFLASFVSYWGLYNTATPTVDSDVPINGSNVKSYTWYLSDGTKNGGIYQRFRNDNGNTKFNNGQIYTVSAWIKSSASAQLIINVENCNASKTVNTTTSWQRFQLTFTGNGVASTVTFYGGDSTKTVKFYICMPKLETGNKATDWTPAPEDTQGQIDSATTRISTAETSITQLNTSITLKVNTTDFNTLTGRVSSTESSISTLQGQITSKVDVNGVKSVIQQNPSDIQIGFNGINNNVIIDATGFTIKNGAVKIKDSSSNDLFWVDSTGKLTARHLYIYGPESGGNIDIRGTGNKGIALRSLDNGQRYFDFTTLDGGTSYAQNAASNTFTRLLANGANFYIMPSQELHIYGVNPAQPTLGLVDIDTTNFNVTNNMYAAKKVSSGGNVEAAGKVIGASIETAGAIYAKSDIKSETNVRIGSTLYTRSVCHMDGTSGYTIPFHSNIDMQNLNIFNVNVAANSISCTGTKNRIVTTEHFGTRALNAVESADCFFIDVGEGKVTDGKCIIPIDPIFKETVSLYCGYQVFITKYGKGDIYVSERNVNYFVLEGDDIGFAWEIKAKQKKYENTRLELRTA